MENSKVRNEQEKINEKNVSPEGCKKTRQQKTKIETNSAHNSLKPNKKAKAEGGEESKKVSEDPNEFEEYSKETNSFQLQNKQNVLEATNEIHQNLGHPLQPNFG